MTGQFLIHVEFRDEITIQNEIVTPELRWKSGKLQQKWEVSHILIPGYVTLKQEHEWRDVPEAPMTEMIDRVSKAIDAAIDRYFAEWKAKVEPDGIPWIGVGDIPREVFAKAAIEAMREPTPEMVGAAKSRWIFAGDELSDDYVDDILDALIDAALEEKPE